MLKIGGKIYGGILLKNFGENLGWVVFGGKIYGGFLLNKFW